MKLSDLVDILQTVGGVTGAIVTIVGFLVLVLKKPKEKFFSTIKTIASSANEELKEELHELKKQSSEQGKTDLVLLRNTITHIYFEYKDDKKFPHFEKENVLSLFEQYERLGGNSYIKSIVAEMKAWEEIV